MKINMILAFAPAIGMMLGSLISNFSDWKYSFYLLSILGITIMIITIFAIPKIGLTKSNKSSTTSIYSCLKQIRNDTKGLAMGFLIGGAIGIMFGYLSESSFYFLEKHNASLRTYELTSIGICIPMFIGGFAIQLCGPTPNQVISFCIRLIALSTFALWIINLFNLNIFFSIIFFYLILGALSSIIPSCLSQILEEYGKYTGTAASLYGFYYYIITSMFTATMTALHKLTPEPLLTFFLISSISFIVAYKILITAQHSPTT